MSAVESSTLARDQRLKRAEEERSHADWRRKWIWNGHSIRYAAVGEDNVDGAAVLLVHGFGASADHYRYNAGALAKQGYRVYAIDMLGFGLSDKPSKPNNFSTYSAAVWMQQIAAFLREVVGSSAYLVGNSLGGYAVLNAAAFYPNLTRGLVLVNSAGPIVTAEEVDNSVSWDPRAADPNLRDPFAQSDLIGICTDVFKRAVSFAGFLAFRRRNRISAVLRQVYTNDQSNVNDELVDSIEEAALTPNAFEVFYRTAIGGRAMRTGYTVNNLCARVSELGVPTVLLWGVNDPWITNERASRLLDLLGFKDSGYIAVNAGHCPHDENPAEFNAKLIDWLAATEASQARKAWTSDDTKIATSSS
eukprot:CAMPEP_0185836090 /NCGR_PEP_ID=MMETSP1353-20130828/9072_1 /TAXON_ID=1077150 /ORGANISM="Erythrolobus australicus, Strain CCMP3124" /LENGTH=360 /DNA_ID=CAMNT_0028534831 /DNA_START=281 /DNA_END=1363 /DNA_ORIENTATION=-